jgi:membrane complex biogenesis BtpA family protein
MATNERFKTLFKTSKPVIGMVHVMPLPGTPKYKGSLQQIIDFACKEAETLQKGGVDGIQIENQFDRPYVKPQDIGYEIIAYMSSITSTISRLVNIPYGVHIMMNGVEQAIAVAHSCDAKWVRVYELANAYISNSGTIEAAGPKALRYRKMLGADEVMLFGDFHVKHGSHFIVQDRSIEELAHDVEACGGDALILTGTSTGKAPEVEDAKHIQKSSTLPLFIGSGFNVNNAPEFLPYIDGVIVGSALKRDSILENPTDLDRVQKMMEVVRHNRD